MVGRAVSFECGVVEEVYEDARGEEEGGAIGEGGCVRSVGLDISNFKQQ